LAALVHPFLIQLLYFSLHLPCILVFALLLSPIMSTDQFTELAKHTVIVCDTGDIESIRKYQPTDATTNPSLIYAAVQDPRFSNLVDEAISWAKKLPGDAVTNVLDCLCVTFGAEISKLVPGVVSTEVDARLSFDTKASIAKAHTLLDLYKAKGVPKERILIKLASTWEGIKAAEELEKEGIHVNMTLLFTMAQAIAAANSNATLISPFVGRILDWSVAKGKVAKDAPADQDPGIKSVTAIYNYYKGAGKKTIVMGASFRNKNEILALTGCDKLTISPKLLEELKQSQDAVEVQLSPAKAVSTEEIFLTEAQFRWELNEDPMATEKLSEGIRNFAADTLKLEDIIKKKLAVH